MELKLLMGAIERNLSGPWLGDNASNDAAFASALKVASGDYQKPEADPKPYYMATDSIAVLPVLGPMMNFDPGFRVQGMTFYPQLIADLLELRADPKVKQVVLDITSGGGSASGVDNVAAAVRSLSGSKPVAAFTSGSMFSAAYWLGAAADKVYASKMAQVGSIGVIAVHRDYSKAYESMGITTTVLRKGKYKALGNANEPLSDEARQQLEAELSTMYNFFVEHVAERRGVSAEVVDQTMAQGREFFAESAKNVNLIDEVLTFDELLMNLSTMKPDRNPVVGSLTKSGVSPMKSKLQQEPLEELTAEASAEETQVEGAASEAEASVSADQQIPNGNLVSDSGVVSLLKEQLAGLQAELIKARVEVETLREQSEQAKAVVTPLTQLATDSLNQMRVALGHAALVGSLDPAQLAAEHTRTAEDFKRKFPVGGVAAVTPDSDDGKPSASQVNPLHQYMLSATSLK